jgi:4-hydroxy-3-polyprenylbenzoate decarboxylase
MENLVTNRIVVGICGASGSIYGIRLLKAFLSQPWEVHLVISEAGKLVMAHELGFIEPSPFEQFLQKEGIRFHEGASLIRHEPDNLLSDLASGSFKHQGMAIVPCSMKTVAAVASGYATNLMERTADVCLKEKRPLVLVPRETPLNKIHLKNMIKAHNAGAIIVPPSPGFYFRPEAINDLVDFIVARILDQLHIRHNIIGEWGSD